MPWDLSLPTQTLLNRGMNPAPRPDDDIAFGLLGRQTERKLRALGHSTMAGGMTRARAIPGRTARLEARLVTELSTRRPEQGADHGALHLVNETIGLDVARIDAMSPRSAVLDDIAAIRAPVAVAALAYVACRRVRDPSLHAREILAGPVPPGFEGLHRRFVEARGLAIDALVRQRSFTTEPTLIPLDPRQPTTTPTRYRAARRGALVLGAMSLTALALGVLERPEGGLALLSVGGVAGSTIARRREQRRGTDRTTERMRRPSRQADRGHDIERLLNMPLPESVVSREPDARQPLAHPRTDRPALPPASTNSPDWMPPSLRSSTGAVPDAAPRPTEPPARRDTPGRSDRSLDL